MGSPAPWDQPRAEEPGQLDPRTTTIRPSVHTTLIAVCFVSVCACTYMGTSLIVLHFVK